jgi:hypothetical protein
VGGNFRLAPKNIDKWGMGFVGPRFSWAPNRRNRVHLIADLELGVGAGLGGVLHDNDAPSKNCMDCDGRPSLDRVAWGGYQGAGVGVQIGWFSIYGRGRLEESTATHVPTTLWPSLSLGVEVNLLKRAAITLAGGTIAYSNASDRVGQLWFYQVGLTLFLSRLSD